MAIAKDIKILSNHEETLYKRSLTQIGDCSTCKSYGPTLLFHYKETKHFVVLRLNVNFQNTSRTAELQCTNAIWYQASNNRNKSCMEQSLNLQFLKLGKN